MKKKLNIRVTISPHYEVKNKGSMKILSKSYGCSGSGSPGCGPSCGGGCKS